MPPKHGWGGKGGRPKPKKAITAFCRKPLLAANVLCCGCCQIGRQCAAIEGQAKTMSAMHCMGALMGGYQVCTCCIRRKVSEKYGMDENPMASCFLAFWCTPCSLLQTQLILKRAGVRPGLTIKPPNPAKMDGPQKEKFQEARQKRRDHRHKKNQERRNKRGKGRGSGSDSSSESDSSDSD